MEPKDSNPWKRRKTKGFSLIELIIGFAILVFFLLSTAQLLLLSKSIQNRYKDHILIMRFISDRLEYLRSMPYDSPEIQQGIFTDLKFDPDSSNRFRIVWQISDISSRLKSIDISCYPEGNTTRKTETNLYLCLNLEF